MPPYRRLGGDALFTEAAHPEPAPYNANLPVPGSIDVNDPNWYYDVTNAMPDRFVGGRSSSATLYMSAATMLVHENHLSLDDAKDVLAFGVADMVVSGEHSMPECMTPVVLAAHSSQPWQETPLNLTKETPPLTAWMHLVSPETRNEMRTEARAALQQVLAQPAPDPKVVTGLTMVVKATNDFERDATELTKALSAGLNPTPAAAQRVAAAADPRQRAAVAVRENDRDR